jgi:hypothetical protein
LAQAHFYTNNSLRRITMRRTFDKIDVFDAARHKSAGRAPQ